MRDRAFFGDGARWELEFWFAEKQQPGSKDQPVTGVGLGLTQRYNTEGDYRI